MHVLLWKGVQTVFVYNGYDKPQRVRRCLLLICVAWDLCHGELKEMTVVWLKLFVNVWWIAIWISNSCCKFSWTCWLYAQVLSSWFQGIMLVFLSLLVCLLFWLRSFCASARWFQSVTVWAGLADVWWCGLGLLSLTCVCNRWLVPSFNLKCLELKGIWLHFFHVLFRSMMVAHVWFQTQFILWKHRSRLTWILQIKLRFAVFCLHVFVCLFLKNELNNLKKVPIHLKLVLICLWFASICLKISQNTSQVKPNTFCSIGGQGQFTSKCLKMPQFASKFLKISQNLSLIPNNLLICLISYVFFCKFQPLCTQHVCQSLLHWGQVAVNLHEHCHQVHAQGHVNLPSILYWK